MRDSDIDSRFKLVEGKVELLFKEVQEQRMVLNVLGNWALTNSAFLAKAIGVPPEPEKPKEEKKPEEPVIPPAA